MINPNTKVVPIDHGWANMKTEQDVFTSGVSEITTGLSLSGSESVSKGVVLFSVKDTSILNGADYGIEASVITTVVLGMLLFVMVKGWKGRIDKDGIS